MIATIDDVQQRLGRAIDPAEQDQVQAWINDVEAMIAARIPDIEDRINAGQPSVAVAAAVVSNAVIRKVNNPLGKQNERIDDYSYGLTADAARGELFLTDAEWGLLAPASASGAFSIRPYGHGRVPGTWITPSEWVPLP